MPGAEFRATFGLSLCWTRKRVVEEVTSDVDIFSIRKSRFRMGVTCDLEIVTGFGFLKSKLCVVWLMKGGFMALNEIRFKILYAMNINNS